MTFQEGYKVDKQGQYPRVEGQNHQWREKCLQGHREYVISADLVFQVVNDGFEVVDQEGRGDKDDTGEKEDYEEDPRLEARDGLIVRHVLPDDV